MKHLLTLTAFCMFLGGSVAFAKPIDSVMVTDFDNSVIEIKGKYEALSEDKNAALVFVKNDVNMDNLSDGDVLDTDKMFIKEIVVPKSGEYTLSFTYNGEYGEYLIYATDADSAVSFIFITKDEICKFLNSIADGSLAADSIFEKLEYYSQSIGYDISYADTDIKKDYTVAAVKAHYGTELIDDEYTQFQKKKELITGIILTVNNEFTFLDNLKTAGTAAEVNKLILENSDIIDLTEYNKLNDDVKSRVCTRFVRESYTYLSDFIKAFNETIKNPPKDTTGAGIKNSGGGGTGGNGGAIGGAQRIDSVTVAAVEQEQSGTFSDLSGYEWAETAINYLSEKNIISGIENGKFGPELNITREQLAKIMSMAYLIYDETAECDFTDIPKDSWAYSYVASAKANDIMKGLSDTEFGYGRNITREDLAVVLYRASIKNGKSYADMKTDFYDYNEISDYAKEAVSYLAGAGIINGYENKFNPQGNATRAEAALLVYSVTGGDK